MSPGILNERMHVYVATELTPGPTALEPGEDIATSVLAWPDALAMIERGEIHDAKTVAGLLFYDRFRRGLPPQSINQGPGRDPSPDLPNWLASLNPMSIRQDYVREVEGLRVEAAQLTAQGKSLEEVARILHQKRRDLGVKYKSLSSPEDLARIHARNLEKYGDLLGPSIDFLRAQGKDLGRDHGERIADRWARPGSEMSRGGRA